MLSSNLNYKYIKFSFLTNKIDALHICSLHGNEPNCPTMYMSVTLNKEDSPGPNIIDLQRFNHIPDFL
jgi:hypothetical protein